MSGFQVINPGVLTLIQDNGRLGYHRIGLATGGPLDPFAFIWANRLCGNRDDATALEISIGGLVLEAQLDTMLVLSGADMPLKINGVEAERWHAHKVQTGDRIEIGFSRAGLRAYLAVSGGFLVTPQFDSTATVIREKLGGLNGGPLSKGDVLPATAADNPRGYRLPVEFRPDYRRNWPLRVIAGYQQHSFSTEQRQLFFSSQYLVTELADRMGYRLQGPDIAPARTGILSEGICLGAIQVPPDGQPIVLLNDRQTIGGYPKLGSMFSLDTARLAQMAAGTAIRFEQISQDSALQQLRRARHYYNQIQPQPV